jgi:hypothetical protein
MYSYGVGVLYWSTPYGVFRSTCVPVKSHYCSVLRGATNPRYSIEYMFWLNSRVIARPSCSVRSPLFSFMPKKITQFPADACAGNLILIAKTGNVSYCTSTTTVHFSRLLHPNTNHDNHSSRRSRTGQQSSLVHQRKTKQFF